MTKGAPASSILRRRDNQICFARLIARAAIATASKASADRTID